MPGFEYGNTRLRAMKSRLLSKGVLMDLAESTSVKSLLNRLASTTYSHAVEQALARTKGLEAVRQALHLNLTATLGKVPGFYDGRERTFVDLIFRYYDVHNLKSVLRGLANELPDQEILATLLPIGQIPMSAWEDLVHSSDPREAIDRLASMRFEIAEPLLVLRRRQPGASVSEMELALEQWYDNLVLRHMQSAPGSVKLLLEDQRISADLTNLLAALRFAHAPGELAHLRDSARIGRLEELFVDPGNISTSLLVEAAQSDSLEAALEILSSTPYATTLRLGLAGYQETGWLSEIEEHLERWRLRWMARQIIANPLGIGVVMGYQALKINEVRNLRRISMGVYRKLGVDEIRASLVVLR